MTPARLTIPARCLACGWLYRGVSTGLYLCIGLGTVLRQVEPVEQDHLPPEGCPKHLTAPVPGESEAEGA